MISAHNDLVTYVNVTRVHITPHSDDLIVPEAHLIEKSCYKDRSPNASLAELMTIPFFTPRDLQGQGHHNVRLYLLTFSLTYTINPLCLVQLL